MSAAKGQHRARVHQLSAPILLDDFFEILRGQRWNNRQPPDDAGSGRVHLLHPLVIGRLGRWSGKGVVEEALSFLVLVIGIEALFEPDRALEACANVGAAGRSTSVRW